MTTHASRSGLPTILLDCDPGIDDAYALFYLSALHHAREINLVGVTTTAGNTTVENTARNAAWVLGHCTPTAPRGRQQVQRQCMRPQSPQSLLLWATPPR